MSETLRRLPFSISAFFHCLWHTDSCNVPYGNSALELACAPLLLWDYSIHCDSHWVYASSAWCDMTCSVEKSKMNKDTWRFSSTETSYQMWPLKDKDVVFVRHKNSVSLQNNSMTGDDHDRYAARFGAISALFFPSTILNYLRLTKLQRVFIHCR